MTAGRDLVIRVWIITRLAFALLAVWISLTTGRTFTQMFGNWDVAHFVDIARNGYHEPNSIAFFPGLPLMLRAGLTVGVPPIFFGVALALGCSLAAALALHRLAGPWAGIAWLLAPMGVFTFVPYTEAPFAAAAFWSWERATKGRWGQAAGLACVAASLRVSGVFLIGALVILALTHKAGRRIAWLLLPIAVVGAYAAYLYTLTGSWTAWLSAQQSGWSRAFSWPWEGFKRTLDAATPGAYPDHPEWAPIFALEIAAMAVGVLITLWLLVRRRLAEASWVGVHLVAFGTQYWWMSLNRAVLLWFPVYTELGRPLDKRTPPLPVALVVLLAALAFQAWWGYAFFTGRWAS